MTRIILRLALGILVVVAAAFYIARWGFQEAGQRFYEEVVPRISADIATTRKRLQGVPKEKFKEELKKVAGELGYTIKVIPKGSPKIPPRVRRQLRRGRPFAISGKRGKHRVFVPLGRRRGLAVLSGFGNPGIFPLGVVAAAILGVVTLVAFVLAFPMVQRLRRLERTAERISEGDLEARAEITSSDSIGSLARGFNAMANRVQLLLESQQKLIRAVSHELRTPMSRLGFGLELLDQAQTEEKRRERVAAMEQDLAELESLIQELLTYIRAGDRALELDRQAVAVDDLMEELSPRLSELRPEVKLEFKASRETEPLPALDADPHLLKRALKNLLENALRHCNSRVVVRRQVQGDRMLISISDDGPGVPEDQRGQVFEPFSRLDHSRSRESGGVGLGLAIVKEIAGSHGGEVRLGQGPEGGAIFTLVWPLHQAE